VALGGLLTAALVPPAFASDYFPTDITDLQQAFTDTDTFTTITLQNDITTPAGTVLIPTTSGALNIDTSNLVLNLDGAGTILDTAGYSFVGLNGTGSADALTLTNGAQMHVRNFMSLDEGGLRVTSGSSFTSDGDLVAGRGGDVAITLAGGSRITTGRSFIGEDPTHTLAADIDVSVDGNGTVWNAGSYFTAGGAQNSVDVTISNGGTIQTLASEIGRNGAAMLQVTGPGSKFITQNGWLYIGSYQTIDAVDGHGTVTISDGGLVSATGVALGVNSAGSTGSLTVDSGGVLETAGLVKSVGGAAVTFDNGTLRATADSTPGSVLIFGFTGNEFTIDPGGMFLDSNGFNVISSSVMSGTGGLTKQGAGILTLTASNTYGGATVIDQGTLRAGIANAFSPTSAHTVNTAATLDTGGLDQTVASLDNAGTVTLAGGAPGSTLTVNGNYVGNNGLLRLGTRLGNSGSVSDRLVINGAGATASGATTVQIVNLGGLGAQTTGNGIEVISATNGATTTAQTTKNAFTLLNGHVDAGAYEYRLFAADASGAGENWYLRSKLNASSTAPTYRTEVPLLAALPEQLRQSSLAMLGNLHQRVGDSAIRGDDAPADESGRRQAWGRVITIDRTISQGGTVSPTSGGRLTGFQSGTDLWAGEKWRTGVYVGQLDGDMDVHGFASGIAGRRAGSNDLRNQFFGIYATYYGREGFYADTVLQGGRHRYDIRPEGGSNANAKGRSLLASVEIGQSLPIARNWRIEPQLQIVHQSLDLDNVSIPGASVRQNSDNGWMMRAGVRLKGEVNMGGGSLLQPYARFNVYRSSSGTDITRFAGPAGGTDIATKTGGTSTELVVGATLQLNRSVSFYGEAGKLWAASDTVRTSSNVNGSLGLKVIW
jgi:outer membrane autotransporter protein